MASGGGSPNLITQVSQATAGFGGFGAVDNNEMIDLDLRGVEFTIPHEELLTLPEFILLSFFPNYPEGSRQEGNRQFIDYNPNALRLLISFFRETANSIQRPNELNGHSSASDQSGALSPGLSPYRAGIIVLREDLDFYVIPPSSETSLEEMQQLKQNAANQLLKEDGIFSGLSKGNEPGTTEHHLIAMLTAGGFSLSAKWNHRDREPNKASVCSLALARLQSGGSKEQEMMAHKLLLFWRKPARRCWWEGTVVDGVKVWTRRVWTLEITVIGLR